MKTISLAMDVPSILRDHLEYVLGPQRIPSREEMRAYDENRETLTEEQQWIVEKFRVQSLINLAIEQKESLFLWDVFEFLLEETNDKDYLEEYYAFKLVDLLPGIVDRAQSLTARLVKTQPSQRVIAHLREAFRCYVYGHYVACLCVCRCALEESLRERLKDRLTPIGLYRRPDGTRKGEIEALIDHAFQEKILDNRGVDLAKMISKKGNLAVHSGKASREISEKILSNLQKLISDYLTKQQS